MERQATLYMNRWEERLLDMLAAMANGDGGDVFLKMRADGSVAGLEMKKGEPDGKAGEAETPKALERVREKLRETGLFCVTCEEGDFGEEGEGWSESAERNRAEMKHALHLHAPAYPGLAVRESRYFVLEEGERVELTGAKLASFMRSRRPFSREAQPVYEVKVKNLDKKLLALFLSAGVDAGRLLSADRKLTPEAFLAKYNFFSRENVCLNRAGVVLFHARPEDFVRGTGVRLYNRLWVEDEDFSTISGGMAEMPARVATLIRNAYKNLGKPIPEEGIALAERVICGTLVDHLIGTPCVVEVYLYPGRIEILDQASWPEGSPEPRNPLLAGAFYRMGKEEVIDPLGFLRETYPKEGITAAQLEELAQGGRRITLSLEEGAVPKPKVEATSWANPDREALAKVYQERMEKAGCKKSTIAWVLKFLKLANFHKVVTIDEIVEKTGCERIKVVEDLPQVRQCGVFAPDLEKGRGKYRFVT